MKTIINKQPRILMAVLLTAGFLLAGCNLPASPDSQPGLEESQAAPTRTLQPAATEAPSQTPEPSQTPRPAFSRPAGYQDYTDQQTVVRVSIPESWFITGIQEGQYAILQSYPADKYIGGEQREAGDTKCDLNLDPELSGPQDLKKSWESSSITTVLAESTITLPGGETANRYEIDSLGRSNLILAELNGRWVILTCFGDLAEFDEIAVTLRLSEIDQ